MKENNFYKGIYAPIGRSGGVVIFDKIDNVYITLMGSKQNGNERIYEFFGGGSEKQDKTALHTSFRELIEELFNIKIETRKLDGLVDEIIKNKDLKNDITYEHKYKNKNMTYFISFSTLEKIYNYIKYNKYEVIEYLDLIHYINTRQIYGKAYNGLNEIERLHLYYLNNDVFNLNLRPVAKRIINYMQKKLV